MDSVERGEPNEAARVELKSQWIDDYDMLVVSPAMRTPPVRTAFSGSLASTRAVVGVSARDAADWYTAVSSYFDCVPLACWTSRSIGATRR
jgi:hypothetical protein